MKFLIFDVETTGLPKYRYASYNDSENWPHAVSIAWELCDETNNLLESNYAIIKPEGFTIPYESVLIHGITQQLASDRGENLKHVLTMFSNAIDQADFLVAHNIDFDYSIVCAELERCGLVTNLYRLIHICTMESSTNFCRIKDNYGSYKWPTLNELVKKLFDVEMQNAHRADVDVNYTRQCFFELVKRKIIRLKQYLCPSENSKIWEKESRINKQLKYYSVKKTPKWNEIVKRYTLDTKEDAMSHELLLKIDSKFKGEMFKITNSLFYQKQQMIQREGVLDTNIAIESINLEITKLLRSLKTEYSKNDTKTVIDYNYVILSLINCDWIDVDYFYINYNESKLELHISLPLPYKSFVNHIKEVRYSYKKDELYNIYYSSEEFNDMYRCMVCNYLTLIISRFFYANKNETVQSVCIKVRSKKSPFNIYVTRDCFEKIDLKSVDTKHFIRQYIMKNTL